MAKATVYSIQHTTTGEESTADTLHRTAATTRFSTEGGRLPVTDGAKCTAMIVK